MCDALTCPPTTHCVVNATEILAFPVGLPTAERVVVVGGAVVVTESVMVVLVVDVAAPVWLLVVWLAVKI